MTKKICGTCKVEQLTAEFYVNRTKPDGLSSYCRSCKKNYNKRHYESKGHLWREVRAAQAIVYRKKTQDYVCEYLMRHCCVDCGESDIMVLEFDHLGNKEFDIARKMTSRVSVVAKEIEKCEVRCANCHRRKTAERIGGNYRTKFVALNMPLGPSGDETPLLTETR